MDEIRKIQLKDLDDFAKSEMFQNFSVVPITPARVKSYTQNPNAELDDVVLYLGFINNQLVAFRSLFAGVAFTGDKKSVRFGWCSGSWVLPSFRRQGFSKHLLAEAYFDWDKKLMFTNYAPESEKLYLKTGWFHAIHQFDGVRCYLFPKTRKLVTPSNKNQLTKLAFNGFDFLIKSFSSARISFFKERTNPDFRFVKISTPDNECFERIRRNRTSYLFKRGEKELNWILENPWISLNDNQFQEKYPFSSFSKEFYYQTIKVFRFNKFVGFFIFSVREGHLKTLYFQIENGIEKEIAGYIKKCCVENKLELATVYNSAIGSVLFTQKFPFLRVKKIGQKIYSTFKVNGKYHFQDGDGDVFFT